MIDQSNNKNVNSTVTAQPLAGGQQTPAQQTQSEDKSTQTSQTPATFQTGMSSTQAGAQQQPTQQKSKGPASSGMFTNIQKYVQKNQPQAQKMASAVTQNVGSQASEIAEQAKQKEAQMKESLAANTAAMEAQKKEAGQIVGGIMGADYDPTTGQYQAPASPDLNRTQVVDSKQYATGGQIHGGGMVQKPGKEIDPNQNQIKAALDQSRQDNQNYNNWVQSTLGDQYDTYQQELDAIRNRQLPMDFGPGSANERAGQKNAEDIAALNEKYGVGRDIYGEQRFQELMKGPTGVSEVGNLNIAQQNQKARALQQLAGTANTEMGRRGLLQDTFRQGGDAYTSGMSGLDQLIVSGDETARTQLVEGVQQQADQLNQQIQTIGSEANKAKMAQDLAMKNFGGDIASLGEDAQAAIIAQVDQQVDDQQKALKAEMDSMVEAAKEQFEGSMKYANEQAFYDDLISQFTPKWSKAGNRDYQDVMSIKAMIDPNINLKEELQKRGIYSEGFGDFKRDMPDISNTLTLGYGSTGQARIDRMFDNLLSDAASYGLDPSKYQKQLKDLGQSARRSDLYGWHGHTKGRKSGLLAYDAAKFKETVGNLFADMQAAKDNALQRQLENKYGLDAQGAQDFMSGASIDRAGVATADQASKMEGLRGLLGRQTDELGTELGESADIGGDTAFFQKLKEGLNLG